MKHQKVSLRREADKLWFQAYLKDRCEVCGQGGVLQGHHFFYKGSYGYLRYFEDNCITLCMKCHFLLHHQDPKKIEQKIISKRGNGWYKKLSDQSKKQHYSFQTLDWYRKNIERLQEMINKE